MKKILAILVLLGLTMAVHAEKADSVGTKVKNGKVYILHKVEKGDGMYGISKKYGVSLSELIAENPGSEKVIKIDQLIWVPTNRQVKLEEPVVEDFFDRTVGFKGPDTTEEKKDSTSTYAIEHIVNRGETLFSIARRYNTSVEVIKNLNDLEFDDLSVGQPLPICSSNCAAISGWRSTTRRSTALRRPSLPRISSGTPILPTSCTRPDR